MDVIDAMMEELVSLKVEKFLFKIVGTIVLAIGYGALLY